MIKLFNQYKQYIKYIIGGIIGLIVLFWIIRWVTPKEKVPEDMKHRLDSLNKASQQWEIYKKTADSSISMYKDSLKISQNNIEILKQKQTIIREYYHETINNIDNYTYDELDSWIRTRYKEYYK